MSGKNNNGEKPAETGLGLNNDPPPAGGTAGTIPAGETSARDNAGEKKGQPCLKMGLERYLQKFPMARGITALLRLKHKADVKTIQEWEAVIKELLKKKVQ